MTCINNDRKLGENLHDFNPDYSVGEVSEHKIPFFPKGCASDDGFTGRSINSQTKPSLQQNQLKFCLMAVIILCLTVWECVSYVQVNSHFQKTDKELQILRYQFINLKEQLDGEADTKYPLKDAQKKALRTSRDNLFIAVHQIGSGGTVISRTASTHSIPLSKWQISFTQGNIKATDSNIIIEQDGIYNVYAQLFLKGNDKIEYDSFHYYISKNRNEKLATSSTPPDSCKTFCTGAVTTLVKLKKGDILYITTDEPDLKFVMASDKAFFGAYMVAPLMSL